MDKTNELCEYIFSKVSNMKDGEYFELEYGAMFGVPNNVYHAFVWSSNKSNENNISELNYDLYYYSFNRDELIEFLEKNNMEYENKNITIDQMAIQIEEAEKKVNYSSSYAINKISTIIIGNKLNKELVLKKLQNK